MGQYDKKPNKVRVGGLWVGKSGVLSGNLGGLRIVIFPEKNKKSERSPDYTIYFEEAERKEGGGDSRSGGNREPRQPASDSGPTDDLDIPFVWME